MIKNERQYRITKAEARRFKDALSGSLDANSDVDPVVAEAARQSLLAQLSDLNEQLKDYERLRNGYVGVMDAPTLQQLPKTIIQARIAAGLTHKALADKLGWKAQQVQRYEDSDYASASFSRLLEVAKALNLTVRHEALVGFTDDTIEEILARLENAGLSKNFVTKRLAASRRDSETVASVWLSGILNQLEHVFGWNAESVISRESPLTIDEGPAFAARFKVATRRNHKRLTAYTVYAHYLGLLVLQSLPEVRSESLPKTPEEFYDNVVLKYQVLSLETVLRYIWSLGIGVLPLQDEGSFDGAYWRVDSRHVIAVKQSVGSSARWLFDLLHDYFHATQHPELQENEIVEEPPTAAVRRESEDEIEASQFAGEVILAGHGDALWAAAAERTNGQLARLKSVLPNLTRDLGIDLAAAANYMAHRVSMQGENWWGAASNLQRTTDRPWEIARDILLEHFDMRSLPPTDRQLLTLAMSDNGANDG